MLAVGMTLFLGALLASAVALVLRCRARAVSRPAAQGVRVRRDARRGGPAAVVPALGVTARWPRRCPRSRSTTLPVVACVAILRYRLYDVDLDLDRTFLYARVTLLLAAVYGATTLALGTALGRGSPWATAGADARGRGRVPAAAARVQDGRRPPLQPRPLRGAAAGSPTFLDELRAGPAEPEAIEPLLRAALGDPTLELRFFLPEAVSSTPTAGRSPTCPATGARAADRARRRAAGVGPAPAHGAERRDLLRRAGRGRRAGDRDRPAARRAAPPAGRGRRVAGADRRRRRRRAPAHRARPARRRAAAPGVDRARAAPRPARARPPPAARAARERGRRARARPSTSCASWRRACRRPSSTPAWSPRCASWPAARRCRSTCGATFERFSVGVEAAAYFVACEGLTNAVKHARRDLVVAQRASA